MGDKFEFFNRKVCIHDFCVGILSVLLIIIVGMLLKWAPTQQEILTTL